MYGKGFQLYVFSVYFSPVLPSENEQDGRFGIIKNRDLTGISFFFLFKEVRSYWNHIDLNTG